MQIVVNAQPTEVSEDATLGALVESLKLGSQRIAIELNGDIVPRSCWAAVRLAAGDRAEIVKAIGGG